MLLSIPLANALQHETLFDMGGHFYTVKYAKINDSQFVHNGGYIRLIGFYKVYITEDTDFLCAKILEGLIDMRKVPKVVPECTYYVRELFQRRFAFSDFITSYELSLEVRDAF